jgi:hypothetical protein
MRLHIANSSSEVQERLLDREEFIGSNFRGTRTAPWSTGRMPSPWEEQYKASYDLGSITYTVVSYNTPIAWVLDTGVVVIPDVKYSISTTRHQSYLYGLRANHPRTVARQAYAILHSRPSVPRPVKVHKPVKTDYAPVRMEYSESYSIRQGWATSYVDGPASQVGGYATWGSNE